MEMKKKEDVCLEPLAIAKLVSCSPTNLKKVARKLGVSSTDATGLRRLWLRKFAGKCILCGHKSDRGDLCSACKPTAKTKVLDGRRTRTLLKQLPAEAILLKYDCECGGAIAMTAGEVLKQFMQRGTLYRVKGLCRKCREKAKANTRPPKPKQAKSLNKEPVSKTPPKAAVTAPKTVEQPVSVKPTNSEPVSAPFVAPLEVRWADVPGAVLTHRPFAALKEMKICHG